MARRIDAHTPWSNFSIRLLSGRDSCSTCNVQKREEAREEEGKNFSTSHRIPLYWLTFFPTQFQSQSVTQLVTKWKWLSQKKWSKNDVAETLKNIIPPSRNTARTETKSMNFKALSRSGINCFIHIIGVGKKEPKPKQRDSITSH